MHRELVVLSHLRWDWVWQRPQHLVSRIGRGMDRIWFVEEPVPGGASAGRVVRRREASVDRLWLEVGDVDHHVGFDARYLAAYRRGVSGFVGQPAGERVVWLYTPLALDIVTALRPTVLVYDVMDDLASFKGASRALTEAHGRALEVADVVFAGGRSLHAGVVARGRPDAHLFPSGVEPEHYERARGLRRPRAQRVAGFVGVIDERVDLELVAALAMALPDWEIRLVGPVAKIDPASLPQAANITFTGPEPYIRLPDVMAGFDVALMPFADNAATRSISPTKTLEYLAAGLPVVSTPVPDVVDAFQGVVDIQVDAAGFARACRSLVADDLAARDRRVERLLYRHHWDTIAADMAAIIAGVRTSAREGLTA